MVFQPASAAALRQGTAQIVGAIRPTLGPRPRLTAIADVMVRSRRPELLDDAGTIARRIIALASPAANTGAMLLRNALWQLREEVGDGAATAAVMFQTILDGGLRYSAAGGDVVALRAGLGRGFHLIRAALAEMARPLEGQDAIARMAEAICYDPPLACILGEVFDIIGEYGQLEVRSGNGRGLEREYVEGTYWKSSWFSARMITDVTQQEASVSNAVILISNLEFKEADELIPILELAARHQGQPLVIVAQDMSDRALSMLLLNQQDGRRPILAVKAPAALGVAGEPMWALEDLACLTGGRVFRRETGETLSTICWGDLGRARRAWATAHHFGVVGGGGNPIQLRQHVTKLRQSLPDLKDHTLRRLTQERLGRLTGGAALVWVGGETVSDCTFRQDQAERTAQALRGALRDGVVPGGGTAFLDSRSCLLARATSEAEHMAYRILGQALEAPARTILNNAGFEPSGYLSQVESAGPGHGVDVRSGRVVKMTDEGIVDGVSVLQATLRTAIVTAGLALSVDVLVQSGRPSRKP